VNRLPARAVRCAALLAATATWAGLAAPRARAEVIERVVAVVADEAILLSELRRRAAPFLQHALAGAHGELERRMRTQELYKQLLEQLVEEELVEQAAKKGSITVTSLEIDQAIENVRKQNRLEAAQFWEAVKNQGFTEKQYRQDVRKQLLRLKVINQKVRSRIHITDESVRDEYDARLRTARRSQRFRAGHVFLPLAPTASATEVARTMQDARTIRASLDAAGFAAAMAKHGGGDLGWLDQGDLPEALEDVLLGLDAGQISAPVRGPAGVHIFLLEERQRGEASLPAFVDARAGIHSELVERAMRRQERMFIKNLRGNTVVDVRL
jgi:peptidyl-prolyl cis-trans isomerase SurA